MTGNIRVPHEHIVELKHESYFTVLDLETQDIDPNVSGALRIIGR